MPIYCREKTHWTYFAWSTSHKSSAKNVGGLFSKSSLQHLIPLELWTFQTYFLWSLRVKTTETFYRFVKYSHKTIKFFSLRLFFIDLLLMRSFIIFLRLICSTQFASWLTRKFYVLTWRLKVHSRLDWRLASFLVEVNSVVKTSKLDFGACSCWFSKDPQSVYWM